MKTFGANYEIIVEKSEIVSALLDDWIPST